MKFDNKLQEEVFNYFENREDFHFHGWTGTFWFGTLVDQYVQDFFNNGFCKVLDHYIGGHEEVVIKVLSRLNQEHSITSEDISVDWREYTITRKN